MNPRSHLSLRQRISGLLVGALMASLVPGCSPPDGADLEAVPEAKAGCEVASEANKLTNQTMLPGRVCTGCHKAGGQATNSPFTISGTIFSAKNSPCNGGGLANYVVEILNEMGEVQPNGTLRTNGVGNFYSAFRYTTPMKVRIYNANTPDKKVDMQTPIGRGATGNLRVSCNECHQFPGIEGAPGRIYDSSK